MTDSEIKVGDVVNDLGQNGKLMQVVDKAADSVKEYREREDFDLADYKAHPLLDVSDDDTVWTCVFLTSEPTASFSGTYDYPESRLARQPVEEANQDLDRVQDALITTVLTALLETAGRDDMAASRSGLVDVASHAGVPTDLIEEAEELAAVDDHFDGSGDGDA
ncbi:hypothetical protein [Halobacterium salinarum]|uniref:hypothetical protein n=1 Tax=Halobacterium salinarum TaxID=2242 RepID=UPI002553CCA2|nr:hypothetical protein [Halobacterium salinarum]MDL0127044.1 hypothetical protein [Halobacterium salinarum]